MKQNTEAGFGQPNVAHENPKAKEQLMSIVGSEFVSDDADLLEKYSKDLSFVPRRKPKLIVKPNTVGKVKSLIEWANLTLTPLIPVSSGPPHFHGDTVPSVGGAIIVELTRMNNIRRIDRKNRIAVIEPGVTFADIQPALMEYDMRLSMPLMPRQSKSVLTSLLEREPVLVPKYHWQLTDPLRFVEVVWGNGESLRTGDAGQYPVADPNEPMKQITPWGPYQVDYYKFLSAAQGTMGVVVWAAVKCEILPKLHKLIFVPSETLENLVDFTYRILRFRYGDELFLMNSMQFASILCENADEIDNLREKLPPWLCLIGIAGRDGLIKEKVEFQEKDITDIAQQFGLRPLNAVSDVQGDHVLKLLAGPSPEPYWPLRYKGDCQDIFFLTTLNRAPEYVKTMQSLSLFHGYPFNEVGIYIQPVQQGVSSHITFSFPFNREKLSEVKKAQNILSEGSETLMQQQAFFSRPYGMWADMVYNRNAQATMALKKVKNIFDPNNILNPGKLCF
ncbi:MAG: FAD-binding oxidoreductase [Nitrospira sp.]|nr:FAD-binding oxidoreductase [Nitrospira sp.]